MVGDLEFKYSSHDNKLKEREPILGKTSYRIGGLDVEINSYNFTETFTDPRALLIKSAASSFVISKENGIMIEVDVSKPKVKFLGKPAGKGKKVYSGKRFLAEERKVVHGKIPPVVRVYDTERNRRGLEFLVDDASQALGYESYFERDAGKKATPSEFSETLVEKLSEISGIKLNERREVK